MLAIGRCRMSMPNSLSYSMDDCTMNGNRPWTVGKSVRGFTALPDGHTTSAGWLENFQYRIIAAIGLWYGKNSRIMGSWISLCKDLETCNVCVATENT